MRGMARANAQAEGTARRRPGWRAGALTGAALALGAYVVWMGQGMAGSGHARNPWFYLGPWWTTSTVKFLVLAAVLAGGFRLLRGRWRRAVPAVLAVLLLGSQMLYAQGALGVLRSGIPWGFDHPSFMYRLQEFGEVFPSALGGYNPWWNAGTEHFVGVTSGSHAYGLLNIPALKLTAAHEFYGGALVFWFIFAFPWLGVACLRGAGLRWSGALCGGLLLCGASRGLFFWMWHFGTVGAMTSAMMTLPVVALGYRLAVLRRGGWGTGLALAGAAWLMCLWTPGILIAGGLGLGWLWNARRWTWRTNLRLLAAGALTLGLLAPWLWTTWFPCRSVLEHVGMDLARPGLDVMVPRGAQRLLKSIQEWHPVLVVLGLGGAGLLAPRGVRRWCLPAVAVLGLVAGWSREWKPMSQLDRMAIPMAVLAVFPASVLCGRLLNRRAWRAGSVPGRLRREWLPALAQGLLLATFLMGFRVIRLHYANRGPAPLRVFSPDMQAIVDWIRTEVPEDGRVGFAGRTVHFFGGGRLAYLPMLAGREMMGDDYYGFPRGTVEFNYPPAFYRQSMDHYQFFEESYGITHWLASATDAVETLATFPDLFERCWQMEMQGRPVVAYRVKNPGKGTRFLEGNGRVDARINRIDVIPEDPFADRVVIRYNWREGLVCRTPGAKIEPVAIDENLRFIGIRPGGAGRVEIGYRPHRAPLKPNFDGHFHH